MKKVYKKITVIFLVIMLIFGLAFFNYDNIKTYINFVNTNQFTADTDGITNTKLKSLVIKNHEAQLSFNADTLSYSLDIFPKEAWLKITAVANDADATVKIVGADYLGKDTNLITITVSNGISADTTYTIQASKKLAAAATSYTSVQINTYSVTNSGYYRLEVWGAQGGTASSKRGGYGGYSSGVVLLNAGDKLYAGVGGQGATASYGGNKGIAGGYNGGGYGWQNSSSLLAAGGGGASHIALNANRGVLSGYNSYRGEVLIVAGGGAGAYGYSSKWWDGANGGGYMGAYIKNSSAPGTQSGGYAFGQGGSTNTNSIERGKSANQSGGGGGWFGGHAWWGEEGAGGGSGYIGNSRLISIGSYTKHMKCVGCNANSGATTLTQQTSSVHSSLYSDYAKTGSGGAKITRLADISNNYFVKSFQIDNSTAPEEYDPAKDTYQLNVDKFVSIVNVNVTLEDSTAKFTGTTSNIEVNFGYNYLTYTVTAQDGSTKTYTLVILRESLKGKHSSEIYKVMSPSSGEVVYMSENVYSYTFKAYAFQTNLDLEIYTFDDEATYTITGDRFISSSSIVKIIVSAPKVADSVYILNINFQNNLSKSNTYSYTGTYQTFKAPVTGKYSIELWGSSGGGAAGLTSLGGYTYGKIQLEKDQVLYIYVGQSGARANANGGATWNGGGALTNFYNDSNNGTGGGATDVRLVPTSSTTTWNEFNSLKSRIMVAGSGGGYVTNASSYGSGGGLQSYQGSHTYSSTTWTGTKATQTSGNSFGRGADSARASAGGGYFGGYAAERASAGGSSYISGHTGAVAILESSTSSSLKFRTNASGQQCTTGNTYQPCSYHYSGFIFEDTKMIDGRGYNWTNVVGSSVVGMPNTAGTGTENGHSGNGYAKISALFLSNNNYLQNIATDDGVWEEEYNPELEEYHISVGQYVSEVTIFATKYNEYETVVGTGIVELEPGLNTYELLVTAQDGSTRIYTLNITRTVNLPSSELYKFSVDDFIQKVEQGETEFSVDVSDQKFSFNVVGYPYDPSAIVTYSGFGYVKQNKTCYIIVTNENANPRQTIYTVDLVKGEVNSEVDFGYTGTIQSYKAPADGYYQLEVWGAQGGNTGSLHGGYGAYSTGLVYLQKDEELFIGVGGQGGHANKNGRISVAGGYNGGGIAWQQENSSLRAAGGGGATHIAKTSNRGILSKYNSNRDEVLIVASGGAGAYGYSSRWWNGNSGGGYVGGYSNNYSAAGTQTSGYKFGQGGSETTSNIERGLSANQAGGGGGWYGGHAWWAEQGAGGGSSYIGHVVNVGDYIKHMTCYGCATNSSTELLTKQTSKVSNSAISDYAKTGNGAARITYINFSTDNYLKNLKITDITDEKNTSVIANESITDDTTINENLTINVASTVTKIRLESKPNDSTAIVSGNGTYYVQAGSNTYTIVVTAENQSKRTYTITITRDKDTNPYPNNIEINGLVQSLCKQDENYCKLKDNSNNTITFDQDTDEYYMTVPSRIKQVKFNVIKGHYYQSVTGDGIQDLTQSTTGTTDITIDILSEKCTLENLNTEGCASHYTYHITRDTASDTDFSKMYIDNPNIDDPSVPEDYNVSIDFNSENPDVFDYYFSIPNEWTYLKYLTVVPDAQGQEISIENNEAEFEVGKTHLVTVTILAPNKVDSATYRLHVYRELNSNIYLASLVVKDDDNKTYDLNLDFKKTIFDYEITIPYEINKVNLTYTPEEITTNTTLTSSKGIVSGTSISNIPTGKTEIQITTTSQKGGKGYYNILLTRTYNDDSSLSNIIVKTGSTNWELDPEYSSNTLTYTVNVAEGTKTIDIVPTLSDTLSGSYKLLDNNSVVVGTNPKRILVTAEDLTYTTYTLNVIRPASTDSTVSSLTVNGSDSKNYGVALIDDTYEYTVNVPNEVTFVNVNGVKNSNLASIYGNGKYYLKTGNNSVTVTVQAESGDIQNYIININRAYSSDAYISSISVSGGNNVVSNIETLDYTINVSYTTVKTNLLFTPHVTTTYITAKDLSDNNLNAKRYNNSYTLPISLVTGDNKFKLVTLAEDGTTTLTYNVNVVKAPSNDATLKTLRLKETRLVSTSEDKVYTAKLPYNVDPVHLIVEVNDTNSNYSVSVSNGLTYTKSGNTISGTLNETDENKTYTITVTVTAEDATVEVYTIDLTMQAFGNASNYLTNLSVDKGTLTPSFDQDEMYYEVSVGNEVSSINVSGTLDDPEAEVSGLGSYNLSVGVNEINVTVTATVGLERVYQIFVTRAPSSDATLKQININGGSLNPGFVSSVLEYTTSVDNSYIDFSSIVPTSSTATYEVINNEPGTLINTGDEALVTIKVTAEDKVTIKEYKITVTKLPSGNNNLASLTVEGYSLNPIFDKATTSYKVNVENEVSSVVIDAKAEDVGATISGTGSFGLQTGSNTFTVNVTSESGVTKSYLVTVVRAYSNNALLSYLSINNGILNETFVPEDEIYTVVVNYDVTELNIDAITADSAASYVITGNNITSNSGIIYIIVTAEDKVTTKTYTLNVTKDVTKNALLKSLNETNYDFTSEFNSNIFNYSMTVNYETTSLDLTAIPVVEGAHIDILNNTLIVGENIVTVKVIALDNETTQDYVIKVTRNKEVNNFLDYLYNDYHDGDFDKDFDKTKLKYYLTVDSETTSIILYGEAQSKDSIIDIVADGYTKDTSNTSKSYLGTFAISKGENKIKINVSNQGYVRTYIIYVTRERSSEKELLSLIVRANNKRLILTPEFEVGNLGDYTLTVSKDVNVIDLSGEVSPLAEVSGLGEVYLEPGLNVVNITVTAEDGSTEITTIKVTKEASSEAHLVDLVPSSGSLSPAFGYETLIYDLELDSTVLTLSFEATLEDGNGTISGIDLREVPVGLSTRTIVVTAEDKVTTRTYTINISKIISEDADLLNLKVKDYDFINPNSVNTKVTFDKDTLEYYVIVKNEKKTLSENDLEVTKSDSKSKISYSSETNLSTKEYTEYALIVTAEDGVTKKTYKIFAKRELGSDSSIYKVYPTTGYLETSFVSNDYNYVWRVPVGKQLTLERLGAVLKDENASIESTLIDNNLSVVVTSEDGSSTTTYIFTRAFDYNTNVLIESLKVFDSKIEYPYEPEVNDEVFTYTAHVYDNLETVDVLLTPQVEEAKVLYENEEVQVANLSIPDETNTFTFEILGEDGETKQAYTIIIKKDISTVDTIENLEIVDTNNVCSGKLCQLTPAFSPTTASYKTSVPFEYEKLTIKPTLHEQQTAKYFIYQNEDLVEIENGNYELDIGTVNVYTIVYDLLGKQLKSYKITVTKNKSTNTKLNALSISNDGVTYPLQDVNGNNISYNNSNNEYYITVPYGVEEVTVNYTKNEDSQKVTLNGYNNFYVGEINDISVKVLAPDKKTTRTIIIHAYRESQYEVYLEDITISSGQFWDLVPEFDKRKTSYVVNVSNGTEYVKVEGFGDVDTIVSEAETRLIETGVNTFTITAGKEYDGEVYNKTYTVTVIRPIASEVYLSNLKVSSTIDGEYLTFKNEIGDDITFDRGTTDYYLEVSPGIKKLNIDATPGRSEWNVNIYGNNFATGRNIVSIIVYNEEYTTSRTYQLVVTVKPSQDASITAVTVKDDEETYGVSAEDFLLVDDNIYSVNVPYDVDKVDVSVTPTIDVATVQGNGTYYLDYGNNVVTIDVIAEDGETTETYTVNIFRAYNLYLSAINEDCDEADIKEEFLKTKNDYTMEVSNDVTSFSIEGIPEESNVTVTYSLDIDTAAGGEIINGKLYTGVGVNKVLITVTAPDNTSNVYSLNVARKQSDNNYLSALDFNEGNLNETFIKENNNYTMYVLDTYTSLSYDNKKDILTEDPTASYVVSGLSPLSKTQDNTVTITVTSQSGKTNIYTVTVMLKPEAWFKHYLEKLELTYKTKGQNNEEITNNAILSPQFNMEKMAYTSTVPYGVTSIIVDTKTVVPDDEALIRSSTEIGSSIANGTFALNLGRNVINVKVYSTLANNDGSYAIYKVIVYRQSNPDAYLSNLAIANHVLSPGFSSTVFNYAINIDTSETELDIDAVPRDPNATVTITGNGPFHEGSNTITINVLAADGETYLNYYVTANCQLSDNNYLASLDVKDYEIDPGFTKTNTGVYLVNVDNDVTSVYVTAIKEDQSATMTLQNGSTTYTKESTSIKLNPGNNYIYIAVSSARGNTRTYTLNVFRSYSTDNTLRDLIISDGTLKPTFDPETKEYDVILEDNLYYLSTVSVIGLKNHSKASVRGNGEYTLNESGTKTVTIEVTAESGDKREYKVNFIKKEAPSSQLLFLEVYEGELIPEFSKDGYKYYVTVPNEVTSLDLEVNKNVVAVDEDAEITITGNSNFKVGINVVTIKVTASNNDVKNYYLYVTRSILASNYLSDLYVDNYEIDPEFMSDNLYYELTVGSNVESVHVHGDKEDPTSTLEINGSEVNDKVISLKYGENKVYFTVTSDNGATRTYTLVVTRSDSDEYYLLTLETNLGSWDKDFDKDDNGLYTINVPEKTSMIVFTGTTSVGSTVEGLDSVQVKLGDNNHKVIVTSPSGLKNTYNFKIVRPGSNNTDILSITSNHGDLTLEDNVYKLSVDDSDSNISFIVNLSDPDAKVIMNSSYNLTYGKNEITITIQAEDGTEKEVAIEIYRYRDIESISYDEDEIILNINEKNTPIYTINPENTDYKEVTFRSDDESIAIVDSNGEITAVGPGITYVYVVSSHNERIFDWIRVNVASTKITSQVYNIWRVGESENNLASVDFSYVIGANDKTRIDDFETHFDNDPNYLKVYSKGELVPNVTDYVGTGMILKLEINGVVFDELTIIVRGDNGTVDKPGNGIITSTDYATLSSILAGLTVKTPIISLLYDLNKNKILTVTDLSPMSLYIAGKATFTNLNGLN